MGSFTARITKLFGNTGYLVTLESDEAPFSFPVNNRDNERSDTFMMQFNPIEGKYKRAIYEYNSSVNRTNKQRISKTSDFSVHEFNVVEKKIIDKELEKLEKQLEERKKKYSTGVYTYQLINGEEKRIYDRKGEIFSTLEEEENKKLENKIIQERSLEKAKFIASRNQYKNMLASQTIPGVISKLIAVSTASLLIFIVFAIVLYSISESSIFLLRDVISLPWKTMSFMYYIYNGLYLSNSLSLLNNDIITDYEDAMEKKAAEKLIKEQMHEDVNSILRAIREANELIIKFDNIVDAFIINRDVPIVIFNEDGTRYVQSYTYMEVTQLISGALLEIANCSLEDMRNNLNLEFLRYNIIRSIKDKKENSQTELKNELYHFIQTKKRLREIIMIFAICLYFLAGVLIYPFLLKAHWAQEKVLTNFLRIPPDALATLQEKCENYLCHNEGKSKQYIKKNNSSTKNNIEEQTLIKPEAKRIFLKTTNTEWTLFFYVVGLVVILNVQCIGTTLFSNYVGSIIKNSIDLIYSTTRLDSLPLLLLVSVQDYILSNFNQEQKEFMGGNVLLDQIIEVTDETRVSLERILKVRL